MSLLQLHRPRLRALLPEDAATRQLDLLCRARRKAVDARTALSNELQALLKGCFPPALDLIGENLAAPLALDLLARWPQLAELKKARPATLRAFYYAHNVRRPEKVAERLDRVAAARALTTDPALLPVGVRQIRLLIDQLRTLQKHLAGFDAAIAADFNAHPDAALFAALPGATSFFRGRRR